MGKIRLIDPKFAKAIPIFRDERSAETNLKILEALALSGKLSITDIHKKMYDRETSDWRKKTRRTTYPGSRKDYSTINRRVRDLEHQCYVKLYREEPSQKGGKEKKIMHLTEKGWWVVNLVSKKIRSEWRKVFKNYEKDLEEWREKHGVRLLKMMVESPNITENVYNVVFIRPFRDLIVSGYVDLDMVGEHIPDVLSEKSILDFGDAMERLRKHKSRQSWLSRLTKKELQALDQLFHNPHTVQVMDEIRNTFRQTWERTLLEISDDAKKPHRQRSKKLYFSNQK